MQQIISLILIAYNFKIYNYQKMKSLKEYIIESNVSEGLISDVIMELLRRSLNWIDKGIDVVAQNIDTSVKSSWQIIQDKAKASDKKTLDNTFGKNQNDMLKKITNTVMKPEKFDNRLEALNDLTNGWKGFFQNEKDFNRLYGELLFQMCLMTKNSNKSSEQDKAKADKAMGEFKRKYPQQASEIEKMQQSIKK